MSETISAAYGSWRSPLSAERVAAGSLRLSQVTINTTGIYWVEGRPAERGRMVVVCRTPDGGINDVTAADLNVRTRVHEYGGGAYDVDDERIFFSHQRLYRQERGGPPHPITPDPAAEGKPAALRYADARVDRQRERLICVLEDHRGEGAPLNMIAAVPTVGGEPQVLVQGRDFYCAPRISPDGTQLAWLCWDQPDMPWDAAELWVATFAADGHLGPAERIAGGRGDAAFQPEWSPGGILHFVAERTGWWNLYRRRNGRDEPICPMEAEFGLPYWNFGISTYAFADDGRIVCSYLHQGVGNLAIIDTDNTLWPIDLPYTVFDSVRAAGDRAVFLAGSPTESMALVTLDLINGAYLVVRRTSELSIEPGSISEAQPIRYASADGREAHGFFYAPRNAGYTAPPDERPPLLVMSHGGPTGSTSPALRPGIQYWTSRGIAVLDVNYGGSTGYGRAYREQLNHRWGIVDVDDCCYGARHLADQGLVDPQRMAITGGSAGGYTTLAALTFRNVFRAGASYYGISDLEALAHDTHKFEARYLDQLIGPYPERRDLYVERSPIHFTAQLTCPIIFFQGLEDAVVPPNQAERMVEALRDRGLPVAYVPFEGEQHGFRQAANIKRALESEFYFYSRIFGFTPGDAIEPLAIENLGEPAPE
ncbi:MAG TPA: S9 family peptidase [Roseiflexaceae bacterium]|nr:S9 family peptidase [Roseiflexaceae bacterium]